jgi:hypothetical protein
MLDVLKIVRKQGKSARTTLLNHFLLGLWRIISQFSNFFEFVNFYFLFFYTFSIEGVLSLYTSCVLGLRLYALFNEMIYLLKKRVKHLIGTCGFTTLFFAPCIFISICITDGTCAMRKDGDGISVRFSVQN